MLSGDGDYDAEGNFVGVLDEAKKKKRKVKGKKKPERVDALPEVPIEALEAGLDREARIAAESPFSQVARAAGGLKEVRELEVEQDIPDPYERKREREKEEAFQQQLYLRQQRLRATATEADNSASFAEKVHDWSSAYAYKGRDGVGAQQTTPKADGKRGAEKKTAAEKFGEWADLDWEERLNPKIMRGIADDPKSFMSKEKRKRDAGQQATSKNFIEEEKRILRQAGFGGGL
ncbi:hypothetical protein DIPPA_01524 [Diplonema papillatum]|nr:hypothetical protein DIPPA_01524 [Diplonema papillatum]